MNFSKTLNKKDKELYVEICSILWGCVPIEVDWAMGTNSYKDYLENILIDKNKTKIEKN